MYIVVGATLAAGSFVGYRNHVKESVVRSKTEKDLGMTLSVSIDRPFPWFLAMCNAFYVHSENPLFAAEKEDKS